MALQIWLPLNKDTRNVGLNNVKATNNGATLTNGGIYNDCYHFGTSASYITIPPSCMTGFTTECSVSFWIKIKSWNTAWSTYFQAGTNTTAWAGYVFGFLRNNSTSKIVFVIGNGSTTSTSNYVTSEISLNTWYHVTITYETGKCKIYLNGVLDKEYTTTYVPDFTKITRITLGTSNVYTSYQTDCDMNDFRIYDNALTEDDIKNLCKINVFDLVPYKDDIRGGILFDRSGYCLSAVTPYNLSYKNSCAVFNGTNSSIQIPPMTQINSGGLFTMNVWFLKSSFGSKGWETIFGGPGGFELETKRSTAKNPVIVPYSWGGRSSAATHDMPYSLSAWTMVSMVRNASNCKFFVDGELKYTGTRGSIPNGNYFIGSWSTTSSQNFKGNVSNFKLYRKDLTDEEIAELYEKEKEMFLPDDYEELEYVESNTGQTCYINTGVKLNNSNFNNLRIEVDGNFGTDTTHWRVDGFSGTIGGAFVTRYIGINPSSKLAYGNKSDTATSLTDSDTDGRHSYIVDYKNGYVKKDGDTIVTFTPHVYTHTFESNLFIFTWNTSGTKQKSAKKYGVKFFFDDVLTFNGIPAKRKSDNVIGMYDMISRQFFTNAGTGDFTGA